VRRSNQPPANKGRFTALAYTENAAATQIDATATLVDRDGDAAWNGGTLVVQITTNHEAEDGLFIADDLVGTINTSGTDLRNGTTVIGTLSAAEGSVAGGTALTITFNANATNTAVQQVLQSVQYASTSNTPGTGDRTVTVTVTDATGAATSDTRTILPPATPEIITSNFGDDVTTTGPGDDIIIDAGGNNTINAGAGNDRIGVLSGMNTLIGGAGDDLIIGGSNDDDIAGGTGNDVLSGDIGTFIFGDDLMMGGGGADVFVFDTNDETDTIGTLDIDYDAPANTTVTGPDFVSGVDRIDVSAFGFEDGAAALAAVSDVDGVATFWDQGTVIVFNGLTADALSQDDFIFV
jgi:Ca2+-binding RTX toxin-like protein